MAWAVEAAPAGEVAAFEATDVGEERGAARVVGGGSDPGAEACDGEGAGIARGPGFARRQHLRRGERIAPFARPRHRGRGEAVERARDGLQVEALAARQLEPHRRHRGTAS